MAFLFQPFTNPKLVENFRRKGTEDPYQKLSLTQNFLWKQERPEIFSLVALAEPISDIIVEVDESIMKKYGLKSRGTILIKEKDDEKETIFEELEKMPNVEYALGGSAQNTVRVLRWCLNFESYKSEIFKVSMIGSIGDDLYKDKILASLKKLGVNPIFEILKNDKTSRCAVCIYKKEKSFATQIMASKRLSEEFVKEHIKEITAHQALLIEGYMVSNKIYL
jgi:sugar/nucleoside kinase (ribokinase family)